MSVVQYNNILYFFSYDSDVLIWDNNTYLTVNEIKLKSDTLRYATLVYVFRKPRIVVLTGDYEIQMYDLDMQLI